MVRSENASVLLVAAVAMSQGAMSARAQESKPAECRGTRPRHPRKNRRLPTTASKSAARPLPTRLRKNIRHQYYEAGHMMYLHDEDLAKLKKNVAAFIDTASKQ